MYSYHWDAMIYCPDVPPSSGTTFVILTVFTKQCFVVRCSCLYVCGLSGSRAPEGARTKPRVAIRL